METYSPRHASIRDRGYVYAFLIMCILAGVAMMALAGCAASPTQGSSDAATVATTQADVQWACFGLTGMVGTVEALSPALNISPTSNGAKALASGQALLSNACTKPFDPTNAAQDYQVIMDTAGQVAAIAAGVQPTQPIPVVPTVVPASP